MKRLLLLLITIIASVSVANSQGFGYDSRVQVGEDLFKVKSGEYYGIINQSGNVVVSIEYQDIVFKEGKALLTKNDILYGIIYSNGNIKRLSGIYKVHPQYRYIYEGMIIVSFVNEWMNSGKWGFIDENETPFKMKQKIKGAQSTSLKSPTMFDYITPFVNGYAVVHTHKSGWRHIDKNGFERFNLEDKKNRAIFRSSVHKGECIIATDAGIKLYQENNLSQAMVKRVLTSSSKQLDYKTDKKYSKLIFKEGILTLDSLMRACRFETEQDSIIFIEEPRKVVVKKVTAPPIIITSIKDDLKVELLYRHLQANEKGQAYTELKVTNTSDKNYEDVTIVLESSGTIREWKGKIEARSNINIAFNMPARFSSASIARNVLVEILYKDEAIDYEYPITIKRYNPIRSR